MKKLSNSLFQKSIMATSVSAILLAMASCGGGGSSDSGSVSTVQMSGAVVDDYVAYATVYVDVNKMANMIQSSNPVPSRIKTAISQWQKMAQIIVKVRHHAIVYKAMLH